MDLNWKIVRIILNNSEFFYFLEEILFQIK